MIEPRPSGRTPDTRVRTGMDERRERDDEPRPTGGIGDDRGRRAPTPGARLGWLRRGTDRAETPQRGIQRLGIDDDEPIEHWPELPDLSTRSDPPPEPASPQAVAEPRPPESRPVLRSVSASFAPPLREVTSEHTPPVRAPIEREAEPAGAAPEHRLLSVLNEVSLSDFPVKPQRLRMDPDAALARLNRGDWLELTGRDGEPQDVKVAWINSRRTVVLLVRRPDRRALSLRVSELRERFATERALLIV